MIEATNKHKWKVGKHVIVNLPYQRRAIGEIQLITENSVHVMYNNHVVVYGIDGEDISFKPNSVYHSCIRIPKAGELSEVILENHRTEISQVDFDSLTSEQVNAIYREMKRLGIFNRKAIT